MHHGQAVKGMPRQCRSVAASSPRVVRAKLFLKVMETDMEVFVIIQSLRSPRPRNFYAAETKSHRSDEARGRVFDPLPFLFAIGFVAILTLTLESLPF